MSARIIACIAAICCTTNSLAQNACLADVQRTAYLMGSTLRLDVCAASREQGIAASEAAFAEVGRLEAVLSSWTAQSEVGRLNSLPPSTRATVSPELFNLLAEAGGWVRATNGAFDPGVGALIDLWGFRSTPSVPTAPQIARALEQTGWSRLVLEDSNQVRRGPAGWWLDTGGFGKGAALARVAHVLQQHGVRDVSADFGGQLLIIGQAQKVAVADPRDRNKPVKSLLIRNASVATSSQSERYIEVNGKRYGHILDPRTGMPVPAWGSVTVVSRDALAADALSTALFVMGARAALQWAEQHPAVGVLVLESTADGVRATWSRAMNQWFTQES